MTLYSVGFRVNGGTGFENYRREKNETHLQSLTIKYARNRVSIEYFCFFLCSPKETHEIADAQIRRNASLRAAFGVSEHFVEGSSFDPERKAKEAAAKVALEETKYALIPSPPSSEEEAGELPPDETSEDKLSHKSKKRSR